MAVVWLGRLTFEAMAGHGMMPVMKTFVFSRTLKPQDHPELTIVNKNGSPQELVKTI